MRLLLAIGLLLGALGCGGEEEPRHEWVCVDEPNNPNDPLYLCVSASQETALMHTAWSCSETGVQCDCITDAVDTSFGCRSR